jgi:hypothetical protein
MNLIFSRNLSPNLGFATAAYFKNFPQYDTALALAVACITNVKAALSLSFLSISSK